MMVGYATDHKGNCYKMLNIETNQILLSRDVQWLNRMYFHNNTDEEDEDIIVNHGMNDNGTVTQLVVAQQQAVAHQPVAQQQATTIRSGRAVKAPARFLEEMEATAIDKTSKIMALGARVGG